jgi:hypothetical protein
MALTISGDTPNFSSATITTLTAPTSTITTLNAPSGVLATQNGMTGIPKAWVNFTGGTATINGSFNVSSVTRSGTGIYVVNYTTAMPNANYCAVAGLSVDNVIRLDLYTTTNIRVVTAVATVDAQVSLAIISS